MKKFFVLLCLLLFLSGCGVDAAFNSVLDGVFGWIPGYESSSSQSQSSNSLPSDAPFCEPHGYLDGSRCICDDGYVQSSQSLDCIPGRRECIYDSDCGTNRCDGNSKVVFRCDLRTYKCIPRKGVPAEKIDCGMYGPNSFCKNGECAVGKSL